MLNVIWILCVIYFQQKYTAIETGIDLIENPLGVFKSNSII